MISSEYLGAFIKDNGFYAFTGEELIDWLKSKYKDIDPLITSEKILSLPSVIAKGRVYVIDRLACT